MYQEHVTGIIWHYDSRTSCNRITFTQAGHLCEARSVKNVVTVRSTRNGLVEPLPSPAGHLCLVRGAKNRRHQLVLTPKSLWHTYAATYAV